jgi:hypothetical protein
MDVGIRDWFAGAKEKNRKLVANRKVPQGHFFKKKETSRGNLMFDANVNNGKNQPVCT